MKPYKHIQDSKKVLKSLISEAKTMDNVKTRLTELNTLITLVNSFEEMLSNKYFTDYFDMLLLSRMYHFFIGNKVHEGKDIPIKEFTEYLRQDFNLQRNGVKSALVDLIIHNKLTKSLEVGEVKLDSKEDWNEILENTLLEVKKQILWTTKK